MPAKKPKEEAPAEVKETSSGKKTSFFRTYGIVLGMVVLLLAATGAAGYFYLQYQETQKSLGDTQAVEAEVAALTKKVGRLMELPQDQEVTLATVSDITKLQGQEFFKRAQNGDKVLIYTKAGKAILYRPSTNKIIDVGPVDIAQEGQVGGSSLQVSPTPSSVRVALYNGTTISGLTRQVEPILLAMSSVRFEVPIKENASRSDYAESIVVDLTGTNKQVAEQLASLAKGKVGVLPDGEVSPENADILVILGQSYVGEEVITTPTPTP